MSDVTRMTAVEDLPELLRVHEVATWSDVSKGVVYMEIRRGHLPHVTFGRIVRVTKAGLIEWMARQNRIKKINTA
jgi:excisionase family DNA binding protein